MTLNQLGRQYLEEEKNIRQRICCLRNEIEPMRGRQRIEAEQRLNALYSMALDTHRIGKYLINYYDAEVTGDVYSALKS